MANSRVCSIPNCGKPVANRRGWCANHYRREWKKAGGFSRSNLPPVVYAKCKVDGCDREEYGKQGICNMHWQRLRKGGSLNLLTSPRGAALAFCRDAATSKTDQCIVWPFPLKEGYGFVRPPIPGRKGPYPQMKASRYVCTLAHGDGGELHALHTCHNSACVNPAHLYWGTNDRNIQDKLEAGRQPRGSEIRQAKLTEEQAREIKYLDISAFPSMLSAARHVGPRYNVSPYTVKNIWVGATWKYL